MTQRVILDWANYQGVPDPKALGAAGVMIKATEGNWPNTNPFMDAQAAACRLAGIPFGFYTFWHPGIADTSDAQLFLQKIAGWHPQLGLAIDAEVTDGVDPVDLLGRLVADLKVISAAYPFRAMVYTEGWWLDDNALGPLKAELAQLAALWIAGYTASLPPLPYPWTQAILWQFTDQWRGQNMDASYFLGSDDQWNWMIGRAVPEPMPFRDKTELVQKAVHGHVDGIFGPDTDRRVMGIRAMKDDVNRRNTLKVRYAQQVMAFPGPDANGHWDVNSQQHTISTIKAIQAGLGCPQTGTWDADTEFAFLVLDPLR